MEQTAVEKKFGKYVMASMITMFLQSAYSMIDGLFVSNLIGDTAFPQSMLRGRSLQW